MKINYYVWGHTDAGFATKYELKGLRVPQNVTFFNVMEHAERESSERFR